MKWYLKVSYHKVNQIFDPNPLKDSLNLKLKFIYMYLKLKEEGVRMIFIDEFAV
jgi:hypothetical protein